MASRAPTARSTPGTDCALELRPRLVDRSRPYTALAHTLMFSTPTSRSHHRPQEILHNCLTEGAERCNWMRSACAHVTSLRRRCGRCRLPNALHALSRSRQPIQQFGCLTRNLQRQLTPSRERSHGRPDRPAQCARSLRAARPCSLVCAGALQARAAGTHARLAPAAPRESRRGESPRADRCAILLVRQLRARS